MKKISIMLLAALMLFAFVACENNGDDDAKAALQVEAINSKITEVGTSDVAVTSIGAKFGTDGKLAATELTAVSEWATDFGTTPAKGYFLAMGVKTDVGTGATVTAKNGTTEYEAIILEDVEGTENAKQDILVIQVQSGEAVAADDVMEGNCVVTVTTKGDAPETYELTLDLTKVTLKANAPA